MLGTLCAQHPFERKWILGGVQLSGGSAYSRMNIIEFNHENTLIYTQDSSHSKAVSDYTVASICDSDGNLLFYTNGRVLADKHLQVFPGGDTLVNNRLYDWFEHSGYVFNYGALILPDPGNTSKFYIITQSAELLFEELPTQLAISPHLYYAIAYYDSDGIARVETKDNKLTTKHLSSGVYATRHANNRDWWLLVREWFTDHKMIFLLDEEGIHHHHTDTIGIKISDDSTGCCGIWGGGFSNQGDRFVLFNPGEGMELFNFDRLTGRLSDFQRYDIPVYRFRNWGSSAFSPSGRFLYFNDDIQVYQMDLQAEDPASSMVLVDTYDNYYWMGIQFTAFWHMQRTPDCRIAIGTSGFTPYIHLIHEPDQPGLLCNPEKRAIEIPWHTYSKGLPNYPNFCLGTPCENYCDSVLRTSVKEVLPDQGILVSIWPNPVSEILSLQWELSGHIKFIRLYGINGNLLKSIEVSGNSQASIWMHDLPTGFYMVQLEDRNGHIYREKVIKK